MLKDVRKAYTKFFKTWDVNLKYDGDDFTDCDKEEKIDMCCEAIDEIETLIVDLTALRNELDIYCSQLEK